MLNTTQLPLTLHFLHFLSPFQSLPDNPTAHKLAAQLAAQGAMHFPQEFVKIKTRLEQGWCISVQK